MSESLPKSWRKYFPFPKPREEQGAALDFIFNELDRCDDIFLELPTGIGKSGIAITVARVLAATGRGTYISTTTVNLEDQYIRDFHRFGLRQIHSKTKYECVSYENCDLGSCTADKSQESKKRCKSSACPYAVAKAEFDAANVGISNAAWLITTARFSPRFQKRDLLIIDEAHTFGDQLSSCYTVALNTDGDVLEEGDEWQWLSMRKGPLIRLELDEAERAFKNSSEEDEADALKLLRKLELQVANVDMILRGDPEEWVFDFSRKRGKLTVSPLWASPIARPMLDRLAAKRIYLSATLPCFERQAKWLGIDPDSDRSAFYSLPSPFPVNNRLIISAPTVGWKFSEEADKAQALQKAAGAIAVILKRHEGKRGLIHVSSYEQMHGIAGLLNSPRLLTHLSPGDKRNALKRFETTTGAVLISPSSREGLDLFGDKSEFQIIAKLPFASLGDKKVLLRKRQDPDWYALHTVQQIIQAAGRSVRTHDDVAPTYVIDWAWSWLLHAYRHFFPEYFLDACVDARRLAETL